MSGVGEKVSGTTKTPADFLKSIRGRPVVVNLNSGVDYRDGGVVEDNAWHCDHGHHKADIDYDNHATRADLDENEIVCNGLLGFPDGQRLVPRRALFYVSSPPY